MTKGTTDMVHNKQTRMERNEGSPDLFPAPTITTAPTKPPPRQRRLEKRVSIDLIPMSLEEIEWAMEDARKQEEERQQMRRKELVKETNSSDTQD